MTDMKSVYKPGQNIKILIFVGVLIWLPVFFYNEPELGSVINPGMALTPFPSS